MSSNREIIALPDNRQLPFSTVVGFQNLIFVSGIVGRDPEDGSIDVNDVYGQTRQTLLNIDRHLAKANISLANALKATVFLTDMGRFTDMNRAYLEFFPDDKPARSCVAVVALPDPEAMVEIEVIAHR